MRLEILEDAKLSLGFYDHILIRLFYFNYSWIKCYESRRHV